MKARAIYLEAARLVAQRKQGAACIAIDSVTGSWHTEARYAFNAMFRPTREELDEHGHYNGCWLQARSEDDRDAELRNRRVVALCLMAAIVSSASGVPRIQTKEE